MKIVCLDAATLGGADLTAFESIGEFISYELTSKDEVISRISDAQVVMINKVIIDQEVIDNTNLKLILQLGTGVNNIDVAYANSKGIIVKNAAGYSTKSVLSHTFALLFAFLNQIPYYDGWTKQGLWVKSPIFTDFSRTLHTLTGKKHGIIGLGVIGKEVAKASQIFGANVCYYSTSGVNNDDTYEKVSLEELLKTSDVISIHAPLNEKTKNLLSKKELMLLKDEAILINVGRGGIINEVDLAQIMDEKNIRVGLDVLEVEPMVENHPLLNIKNKENLIITPHVAWASEESIQNLVQIVFNSLKEFIENGK
ncbi:D-2-hydroxyacid dehydrogenase [Campylobacter sp. IFREMER_LSEM_CL1846]|uniref:D-2-hydroxyacid dehydrogenase n=1 Tax=unclassified Campylobacter TaxID=2593542 RepID=UPI0021E65EC2|nr:MULTISPECIES: D-2-hydroxyacid dehydrogenase [unclassified Campylobacter]HEC1747745.1 D-2-hydroxyacid dehydrogenase [Campylobacter lari]MCV3433834.1 D-2-hydroxyacid dehydrogenase [Campylobacter sp. IFREMER_LSEM_CL1846]MCV3456366.1 D-2-hydroxyacid dehydrogenase [Campylobacter sp. CNRCH_2016_0050h]HEC1768255.1 D-2-hydroxyacid dehydrogenase [Campylobacter lari]HEC1788846.1 D-2-hydroxyacid dehydrogenase [Campylobacter lari]